MAEIEITASDGAGFAAYMASPETGKGPGILLIQEIFGVNANMRQIADGFAAAGYVVLCPDLFWRQEPGVQLTGNTQEEFQRAFGLLEGFDMEKGIDDLKSTLTALRDLDACTGKAGSVGYCLGGRLAYLMATRSDADCNVSYYGVGIEGLLDEMK
ncbi:MAG: dienelactone hydrolase family protein, partial [Alphaproteobacteria bacterium]